MSRHIYGIILGVTGHISSTIDAIISRYNDGIISSDIYQVMSRHINEIILIIGVTGHISSVINTIISR